MPQDRGSYSDAEEIDRVADEFESACREGKTPLKAFLGKVSDSARPQLLRELIHIDWDYRLRRGETPVLAEYQALSLDAGETSAVLTPKEWQSLEAELPGGAKSPMTRTIDPLATVDENAGGNIGGTGLPDLSGAQNSSAASKAAPVPPKLDGYDVDVRIGEGGMGTVWRGVQLSTRRNVALKLISAAGFASERARQRFDREVEITARLEHPNIARVYDSGINRGVYFYAMELIDGVPLDQFVTRNHLSKPDILRLFALVCRAVHHAHERGVIHRDLKPGNILVSPDGQPHVLDFGLAKALQQVGKDAGISLDGEVAGTPGFMSPEQAAGKSDVDARCDVFSLGVILYRLLTGKAPHDLSGTYLDVLRRISEEDARRPRLADKAMSRELETLLLHALERNPAQRYSTAGDLAKDVENYLAGDPLSARPFTAVYFLRKRVHKHRVKLAATGIVVGLAFIAIVLTLSLMKSNRETVTQKKETDTKELERAAAEKARAQKAGQAEVSEGDAEFTKQNWENARVHYQKALPYFDQAGSSTITADLGLWDVARMLPQPLLTIAPPAALHPKDGAPAIVSVTGGALIFLGDGRLALAGCDDGTLRMWDVTTGRAMRSIEAHHGPVRSISASADGLRALSGGADGALLLWDLSSGKLMRELARPLRARPGLVTRVAFSGDAHRALCAGGATADALESAMFNDNLTLWDADNGKPLLISDRQAAVLNVKGSVTQALFSPDSSRLLTVGAEIVVWNCADGKRLITLPETAMSAAFSADGQWIAAGSSNGDVRLLTLASGQSFRLPGGGSAVSGLWFDRQKDQIITASEDGAFHAMDLNGKERWSLPGVGDISAVALAPTAGVALTATDDALAVWRLAPAPEERELASDGPFPDVAMSRDGRLALTRTARRTSGSVPGTVLWDSATGRLLSPANFPSDPCNGIAFSADGRTIARVAGPSLSVWSLDPPRELAHFRLKTARSIADVTAVALSASGASVAVSAADNSILCFSIPGSGNPRVLTGHESLVTSLSFSADGKMLLSGSDDRTARLWDADTGKTVTVLHGHQAPVSAVAISDDGRTAVTACGALFQSDNPDNSVRTWEIPSGKLLCQFPSQNRRMRSVAVSGDGALIAAAGDEQTVIIWDRATNAPLRTIRCQHGPVLALSFDWTGQTLLCGSNTLSLWNFGRPARQRQLQQPITAARAKDSSRQLDGVDLLAFGNWYAFQGESAWAVRFFEPALKAGQTAPALDLFRCYWEQGDLTTAEQELDFIATQEAPAFYVKLCKEALRRGQVK